MSGKKLCKWDKKERKEELDKLKDMVRDPAYICRKCGRASISKEFLCKPEKL